MVIVNTQVEQVEFTRYCVPDGPELSKELHPNKVIVSQKSKMQQTHLTYWALQLSFTALGYTYSKHFHSL